MADRSYSVTISGNAAPYQRALDQASSSTKQFASTVESTGQRAGRGLLGVEGGFSRSAIAADIMGGRIREAGITAIGFFAGAELVQGFRRVGQAIVGIVKAGSDLTETINKSEQAFGGASAIVIAGADDMAHRFGVVKNTFIDAATSIGLIGLAAGQTKSEAADMGTSLAKLAADATSFFNVPLPDVLDAIRSGLVGQERPLRQFGVLLSETAVQQEGLRLGLIQTGQSLNDQQKVIARASLIQKGLSVASGDLERTQDSLANRFRASVGHVQNWAASLGQRATPAILATMDAAGRLGHDGLDIISGAIDRAQPFLHGLADTGSHVADIFRAAAPVFGTFAEVLGTIGGGALIAVLNVLGTGLSAVSGFLADNEVLVQLLASAYIASLVPALVRAADGFLTVASSFGLGVYLRASEAIGGLATAYRGGAVAASEAGTATAAAGGQLSLFGAEAAGASVGVAELAATETTAAVETGVLAGALRVAGAAFASFLPVAAIFILQQAIEEMERIKNTGKDMIDKLKQGKDLSTESGLKAYIADLKELKGRQDKVAGSRPWWNPEIAGQPILPQSSKFDEARAASSNYGKAIAEASGHLRTLEVNTDKVSRATGLNKDQVAELAKKLGIDLTDSTQAAIGRLIAAADAQHALGAGAADATQQLSDEEKAIQSTFSGIVDMSAAAQRVQQRKQKAAQEAEQQSRDAKQQAKEQERIAKEQAEQPLKIAQAQLGVQRATMQVHEAELALNKAREDHARLGEVVVAKERELSAAYDDQIRKGLAVLDAQRALDDARARAASGRAVLDAELAATQAVISRAGAVNDLRTAEDNLAKAEAAERSGRPALEAELAYARAVDAQRKAVNDLTDAEYALAQAERAKREARDTVEGEFALARAQEAQAQAAETLADAQERVALAQDHGTPRELADAERQLNEAMRRVQETAFATEDAQAKLDKTRQDAANNRSVIDAEAALDEARRRVQETAQDILDKQLALNQARQDAAQNRAVIDAEQALAEARLRVQESSLAVLDSENALTRAREDAASNRTVVEAELNLSAAQRDAAASADQVRDAQRALDEARRAQSDNTPILQAEMNLREALLGVQQAAFQLMDAQRPVQSSLDNTRSKTDEVTVSMQELKAEWDDDIKKALEFSDNLQWIADHGGPPGMVHALQGMGEQGVRIAAEMRGKTEGEIRGMFDTIIATTIVQGEEWAKWQEAKAKGGHDRAAFWSEQEVKKLADDMHISVEDAKRILGEHLGVVDGVMGQEAQSVRQVGEAARLSEGQIEQLQELAARGVQFPTGQALAELAALSNQMGVTLNDAIRFRNFMQSGIAGYLGAPSPAASGQGVIVPVYYAQGGVTRAAQGLDAAIVSSPTVLFGERETEQEAFIPKRGVSPARALGILSKAASWYGFGVTPMQYGGAVHTWQPVTSSALSGWAPMSSFGGWTPPPVSWVNSGYGTERRFVQVTIDQRIEIGSVVDAPELQRKINEANETAKRELLQDLDREAAARG